MPASKEAGQVASCQSGRGATGIGEAWAREGEAAPWSKETEDERRTSTIRKGNLTLTYPRLNTFSPG